MPRQMIQPTPMSVVEAFYGDDLSPDLISAIEGTPREQLLLLLEQVDECMTNWFPSCVSRSADTRDAGGLPPFQPVFAEDSAFSETAAIQRWLKCALLYYPGRLAIPDPVSAAISDDYPGALAAGESKRAIAEQFRRELVGSLQTLVSLRPLIADGTLILMPALSVRRSFDQAQAYLDELGSLRDAAMESAFWADNASLLSRGISAHMQSDYDALTAGDYFSTDGDWNLQAPQHWRELESEIVSQHETWSKGDVRLEALQSSTPRFIRNGAYDMVTLGRDIGTGDEDGEWTIKELRLLQAAEWIWAGSQLGFAPVGASKLIWDDLEATLAQQRSTSRSDSDVAKVLTAFRVPGPDSASLGEVLRLRENEESFEQFRASFEQVLHAVAQSSPTDQIQFDVEFGRHVATEFRRERERVISANARSVVMDKWLSGSLLFGAAGVESSITKEFPVASTLAASAQSLGWLAPFVIGRRVRRSQRQIHDKFVTYLTGD